MSTHVPYLEPLVNFLKDRPELADLKIFIKSHYYGIDEDSQFSPAIWIIPGDTKLLKAPKNDLDHDCKTRLVHRIRICVIVYCPSSTLNHFDVSFDGANCELLGPYMEGAGYLSALRQCILDFNCEVLDGPAQNLCVTPLQLTGIYEPDEHNGHLIHCMELKTTYIY